MSKRPAPPDLDKDNESSEERMINELIRKRKLQQEALLKIMTSMDQPQTETPESITERKKNSVTKNANTPPKKKN